jgi:hypothetical protein
VLRFLNADDCGHSFESRFEEESLKLEYLGSTTTLRQGSLLSIVLVLDSFKSLLFDWITDKLIISHCQSMTSSKDQMGMTIESNCICQWNYMVVPGFV